MSCTVKSTKPGMSICLFREKRKKSCTSHSSLVGDACKFLYTLLNVYTMFAGLSALDVCHCVLCCSEAASDAFRVGWLGAVCGNETLKA